MSSIENTPLEDYLISELKLGNDRTKTISENDITKSIFDAMLVLEKSKNVNRTEYFKIISDNLLAKFGKLEDILYRFSFYGYEHIYEFVTTYDIYVGKEIIDLLFEKNKNLPFPNRNNTFNDIMLLSPIIGQYYNQLKQLYKPEHFYYSSLMYNDDIKKQVKYEDIPFIAKEFSSPELLWIYIIFPHFFEKFYKNAMETFFLPKNKKLYTNDMIIPHNKFGDNLFLSDLYNMLCEIDKIENRSVQNGISVNSMLFLYHKYKFFLFLLNNNKNISIFNNSLEFFKEFYGFEKIASQMKQKHRAFKDNIELQKSLQEIPFLDIRNFPDLIETQNDEFIIKYYTLYKKNNERIYFDFPEQCKGILKEKFKSYKLKEVTYLITIIDELQENNILDKTFILKPKDGIDLEYNINGYQLRQICDKNLNIKQQELLNKAINLLDYITLNCLFSDGWQGTMYLDEILINNGNIELEFVDKEDKK